MPSFLKLIITLLGNYAISRVSISLTIYTRLGVLSVHKYYVRDINPPPLPMIIIPSHYDCEKKDKTKFAFVIIKSL